jgi:aspartyl-tRNA(Asn)/glutamyl-tRNA(Gln) amidotransferase subunit A
MAGGSSGGSAAGVAGGLCYAAIGTDTAGSIREPAALCGCVGFKPTYGRVSARGVIPLSWSLDHVGPIAATVADAAIVLQAIAGYDAEDVGSVDVPVIDYVGALRESGKNLRVGVPRAHFYEDLDAEVGAAMERALEVIRALVSEVREAKLDVPTDRTVQLAESYAYHSENVARTPELYQPETLRRIRAGEKITAVEYIRRRRELDEERRRAHEIFAEVDLLVTPTMPMAALKIADLKKDPAALRPAELILLRNTRPLNVWGLPAISVPCGVTKAGLPIGLQIAGPAWREDWVLGLASGYERAVR